MPVLAKASPSCEPQTYQIAQNDLHGMGKIANVKLTGLVKNVMTVQQDGLVIIAINVCLDIMKKIVEVHEIMMDLSWGLSTSSGPTFLGGPSLVLKEGPNPGPP